MASDALILLSGAGKEVGGVWAALRAEAALGDAAAGPLAALPADEHARLLEFAAFFAAERAHAEQLPVEVLLERALEATGYDLAVLARSGGERRLANLRKLMRLAREYERAEGRDLRGFLAYAATRDVAAAREGEAPLESEGLDAVRLMTIHRAKGLEFPVVCVADLGRQGGGRTERLLLGADGSVGLRLSTPGSGGTVPALAYERLAAAAAEEEDAEERRLFYVAMTRACDRLILSGTADPEKQTAPRPGGPPLDWIGPALSAGPVGRSRRCHRVRSTTSAWRSRRSSASSTVVRRPPRARALSPRHAAHHRARRADQPRPLGHAPAPPCPRSRRSSPRPRRAGPRRSASATPRSASTPNAPIGSTSSGG